MPAARAPLAGQPGARASSPPRSTASGTPRAGAPSVTGPARARRGFRRRRAESRSRRSRDVRSSRRAHAWPSRRGDGECLTLFLGAQRLGELPHLAVENLVEPVERQLDPMIRHTALREVVRPDFLRALSRPDLRAARGGELSLLLLALELVQPGAKDTHRLHAILQLRLLVL